jgi:hypothetical protein
MSAVVPVTVDDTIPARKFCGRGRMAVVRDDATWSIWERAKLGRQGSSEQDWR